MTKYTDDDDKTVNSSVDVDDNEPVDIDEKLEEVGMHPDNNEVQPEHLDVQEQLDEEQKP